MTRVSSWRIKLLGSLVALGLTLWILPTEDVWSTIRGADLALWVTGFGVFLLGHAIAAAKWWLLVGGGDVSYPVALRAHFAGLAANLCLPGVAGGDVVRAGLIVKRSESKSRVAAGALVDRLLDTIGLFILSCAGAVFVLKGNTWMNGPLPKLAVVLILLACSVPLGMFVLARLPQTDFVRSLRVELASLSRRPGRGIACLTLSLLVQSVFIAVNFELAVSTGVDLPLAAWFFAWPLAKLLAIVPVSMAGLGVREAGLAALLAPIGGVPAKVVGVSLLWQSILFAAGLFGGLAFLLSRRSQQRARVRNIARAESES